MPVENRTVQEADEGLRLDRWFRREFPALSHGRLEKLLRKGQVRVDGRRVKAGERLEPGATIRVPPLGDLPEAPERPARPAPAKVERTAATLRRAILFEDEDIIVLNKPAGLAVQGGSGTADHVDGALGALAGEGAERPRLVHRLDKDTSGLLLLAKTRKVANRLTTAFRENRVAKEYWALCAGHPGRASGVIDLPLAKRRAAGGEKMIGDEEGKRAVTDMRLIAHAGEALCWLALRPATGRTHQLRAHCVAIGCPILGDGKYGGAEAFPAGGHPVRQLHLHARFLDLRHPSTGKALHFEAPLPPHMVESFKTFGFAPADYDPELWEEE